jgi:hypothetical protein
MRLSASRIAAPSLSLWESRPLRAGEGKRKQQANNRQGYVMVVFAMILFGIMAMAALVIDIGFARLAQRQMQTAADAAALEGLRFRDHFPPLPQSQDLDEARRLQASITVSQLFDDNLLADDADLFNFGAGPTVKFQARENDEGVHASEFIFDPENPPPDPKIGSLPKVPVYKPNLATNYVNNQTQDDSRGDMVAGKYDPKMPNSNFDESRVSPSINEYIDPDTGNYVGRYFTPNTGVPKNALLVRIRRTGQSPGDNIGTSGATLPYLFGRGSLIDRQSIGNGIKVRATAIATTRPVVAIGLPVVPNKAGAIPIAISNTAWSGSVPNLDSPILIDNINHFWIDTPAPMPGKWTHRAIGEPLPASTSIPSGPFAYEGYACIFETNINVQELTQTRIIGFGFVRITDDPMNPPNGIVINRPDPGNQGSSIASGNATSRLSEAWSSLSSLLEIERNKIRDLNDALVYPLLAPVLVRN